MDYIDLLDRLQKLDSCALSDALDALGETGVVTGISTTVDPTDDCRQGSGR